MRDPDLGQPARCLEDGVDVQERLAHSHEDAVVDGLEPPEVERLVEDLGRGQVAAEPHLPRRAEGARERAARLRREADGAASVAVAHQHGFDGMTVCGAEERLDGAVARLRFLDERQRRERHLVGERLAEPERQFVIAS